MDLAELRQGLVGDASLDELLGRVGDLAGAAPDLLLALVLLGQGLLLGPPLGAAVVVGRAPVGDLPKPGAELGGLRALEGGLEGALEDGADDVVDVLGGDRARDPEVDPVLEAPDEDAERRARLGVAAEPAGLVVVGDQPLG